MKRPRWLKKLAIVVGLALVLVLGIAGYIAYSSGMIIKFDRAQTLHSPVFSPDGNTVYYLERLSSGFSHGLGWEFFTAPATVYIMNDRFTLKAIEIPSGKTTSLITWDVPHEPRKKKNYRNRLFGIPRTELRWGDGELHYRIGLNVKKDPNPTYAETEWATGTRAPGTGVLTEDIQWETSYLTADSWPDEILHGHLEVINYENIAIILANTTDSTYRILARSDTSPTSSEEILAKDFTEYSHRTDIERIQNLEVTREKIYQDYKKQGLPEGEALLRTSDELERMGLYPKSPKITAIEISAPIPGLPVFEISDEEFTVGLFQDIQKAIESPGKEINFWGNYVVHRDFDTSKRLNEWLDAGNSEFQVRTETEVYHMVIIR